MKTITGWHFAGPTLRDGARLPPKSTTLVHNSTLRMCASGYHMSVLAFDALRYAPGTYVARVRLSGVIVTADDRAVGTRRTNLTSYVDARQVLVGIARHCALRAVRVHAPRALRQAGLNLHADKLAALPDDGDLCVANTYATDAADAAATADTGRKAATTTAAAYAVSAAAYAAYAAADTATTAAYAVSAVSAAAYAAYAAAYAAYAAAAASAVAYAADAASAYAYAANVERQTQNQELTVALTRLLGF